MVQKNQKEKIWGWIYFSLFASLIILGIMVKRIWGHPEFMMLFHLPAAVFLILAGKEATWKLRLIYAKQSASLKKRRERSC